MRRTPDGLLCFLRVKTAISRPLRSGYPRRDEEIGLGQRATNERKKKYVVIFTSAPQSDQASKNDDLLDENLPKN